MRTPDLPRLTEPDLSSIIHELFDAVNNQDLSSTSPAWRHASPNLLCEWSFSAWPRHTHGLQEMLDNFVLHFVRHPQYRVKVVNLDFKINNGTGVAQAFANVEVRGIPEGVIRPNMATLKLARGDAGDWEWVGFVCVPGLEFVVSEENG